MAVILNNQLLYGSRDLNIYQTYDKGKGLYGMCRFTKSGAEYLPAIYHYTFAFDQDGTCVVVTQDGDYQRVNLDFKTLGIAADDQEWHRGYILKNSRCNCVSEMEFTCSICGGLGLILNPYVLQHNKGIIGM
ncbi:hypothetical protein [Rufibacter soli]